MGLNHYFRWLGGSFIAVAALTMPPAWAEELQNWSFDEAKSELTFSLSDTVFPEFFLLSEPPRLVLDIPATEIGALEPEQLYDGAVQSIRVAQHTPEQVRIVIELASDIVLTPDQADIQFDEADGQRHWRFRPLVADSAAPAADAVASSSGSSSNLSLSADNLKIPQQPTSTALPIDPYDTESAEIVSVPPLVAAESSGASDAAVATVPDLPPMTVPELEVPDLDDEVIPAAIAESDRTDLPDINAGVQPDIAAAEPFEPEPSTIEPEPSLSSETSLSVEAPVAALEPSESDAVEMPLPELSDDVSGEIGETSVDIEATAPSVETSEAIAPAPMTEPAGGPTETALAPVEEISEPQLAENNTTQPQTIQQPAANRTIVQTEVPAPLVFGQPLPSSPN